MGSKYNGAPMHIMLGALFLLVLGQLLGLFHRPPEAAPTPSQQPWVVGTVIRQERLLFGETEALRPLLPDGTRVTAGEALFAPRDPPLRETLGETLRLLPLPERRDRMSRIIGDAAGHLTPEAAEQLTGLMLAETGGDGAASLPEAAPRITAPEAGIFTSVTDGLEHLLTPRCPWSSLPFRRPAHRIGKLVTSDRWYFSVVLPEPPPEPTCTAAVCGTDVFLAEMTLRRRTRLGDRWLVLLSCEEGCASIVNYRNLSVKFLF